MSLMSGAGPEPSRPLGRLVDRAYLRLGWRLFPAYIATAWLVTLALMVPAVLNLATALHASAKQTDLLMAITIGLCILCLALVVALAAVLCRPQRRFANGESTVTAERVWVSVIHLPMRLVAMSVALLLLLLFPLDLTYAVRAIHFPSSMIPNALAATIVMAGMTAGVAGVGLSAVVRPVLEDLAPRLSVSTNPRTGMTLQRELRVIVPLIAVLTAAVGAAWAVPPGEESGAALAHIGVATALAAAVSVPAAFLLASSVLHPLGELLAAAERVKNADYSTAVPTLVPDELSAVAHAFNEAMLGLAERARLAVETQRLLDDVRASRARLVEAGDEARRRIERDIHDGVQQRIVGLGIVLGMIEDESASLDREDLARRLRLAHDDLITVLAELRELARGQFPTVLESDGLDAALKQLAAKAPMPVAVTVIDARVPSTLETTAYFVVAEALANVAKHAEAANAEVEVRVDGTHLTVRVSDDGRGGALPSNGSGLTGLVDRLAAVNGYLVVDSRPGDGTTLTALMPLDQPSR